MQSFIGIDVGTQGARAVLMDNTGHLLGTRSVHFPLTPSSREEQSPETWWEACRQCLGELLTETSGRPPVRSIAVTSTSGTIIPVDRHYRPLHNAIMYSDGRQSAEGIRCREIAAGYNADGYTSFNTSSGLPKMIWFLRHFPEKAVQLHQFIHAADFITGRLCGRYNVTDFTNVLKSGYDVLRQRWPEYIWEKLSVRREWLQEVVPSGTPLGRVTADIEGLQGDVTVTAGMTDGCASQIAAGAVNPGDWNTTIGTTLVVKGVTATAIRDPQGALYNHRHPEGFWMPGGASNTGADWVSRDFSGNPESLHEATRLLIPTPHLVYPLMQQGERFPFVAPQARGFAPAGLAPAERFAASMEGVAYIERYAYDRIAQLSGEKAKVVFTAGGASDSDLWLTIRSNVLQLPIYKMKHTTGATGAAILAASKTYFHTIMEAAAAMTQVEKAIYPDDALAAAYEKQYHAFIHTLKENGYIPGHSYA